MLKRHIVALMAAWAILIGNVCPTAAMEWDLTGGRPWEARVGHGISMAIGGNDCTDNYCDDGWDTSLLGSIGGGVGYYRFLPNFVFFADFYTGFVRTDEPQNLKDNGGLVVELTTGAEFHAPITGWLDPYLGLGIGWAYLGFWGEDAPSTGTSADVHTYFHGFNFEFRTGIDFYPLSSWPLLGIGPFFRLGMTAWTKGCLEGNGLDECGNPEDIKFPRPARDLPFLVHMGLAAKWGF